MRRFWLPFLGALFALVLGACSSVPQQNAARAGRSIHAGAYRAPPPGFPDFIDHSVGREEISIQAMGLVGVPYRWGGNTPDGGFDCSGLVQYVMRHAATLSLPRTTADMSSRGEPVAPENIAAGDLVFFNTTGRPHSHVGIYVGKLRFVDAPSTGGTVRLDYLGNPYWAKRFDGIRRVAPARNAPMRLDDEPIREARAPVRQAPAGVAAKSLTSAPAEATAMAPADATAQPSVATSGVPAYPSSAAPVRAVRAETRTTDDEYRDDQSAAPVRAETSGARDAFEPPPPSAAAAIRQDDQAGQMPPPAPSSAESGGDGDDPIARFANGAF